MRTAPRSPAQPRPTFRCAQCGLALAKWVGRCPECQSWGTVEEAPAAPRLTGLRTATAVRPVRPARPVGEITAERVRRRSTGSGEFDRVLGGGLVAGQVVLLAGEPGVGKSTLLLTVGSRYAAANSDATVLYVSGEESAEQIGIRAQRIGADGPGLLLADEGDLHVLLGHVETHTPALLIVDSVQTIASSGVEGRAGGVAQVHEVTQTLTRVAKARRTPLLLIGQSTRENTVAGPRALEHLVDTVLTFEGDRHTSLRLLRASKNRFGPVDEVVCFEQADDGLREVVDPSQLFRGHRESPVPGTCVTVAVEGRRPLLAEAQCLVAASGTPNPRRGVSGLDSARVAMLLAVTERSGTLRLGDKDVFVATVGGAKLSDPACDLAVCLAVASAAWSTPLPADVLGIGEVALSGDIRPVPMLAQRVAEAARLGYSRILVPPGAVARLGAVPDVTVVELGHLDRALEALRTLARGR